jgi:DNA-binding NarL/FixJ family response regulator
MIQVLVLEDDRAIRDGLCALIEADAGFSLAGSFGSVEAMAGKPEVVKKADVVLMDIGLPGKSGIEGVGIVKKINPEAEVVMITMFRDTYKVFDSLRAGASGYFLKNASFDEISDAVRTVASGGAGMSPEIARKVVGFFSQPSVKPVKHHLTDKEIAVVQALVDGLSYKLIAARLEVSIETVRYHIKNIYRKLHVNSKAEVISKSLRGEL